MVSFERTGCAKVDALLEAFEDSSREIHNTEHWEPEQRDRIEAAARQAAATPAPSVLERLRERVRAAVGDEDHYDPSTGSAAFESVLAWIDEEREREAKR